MKSSKAKQPKGTPTWDNPVYFEECRQRSRTLKVKYEDSYPIECALIHSYKRTDAVIARGQVMSASSGPKDYLINDLIGVFYENEKIEQVALLYGGARMFVIVRIGSWWFDRAKPEPRRVLVTEA